jgi:hypothetical protein
VTRAIANRNEPLGDSALVDYQAAARGYLTFLAQVGPGFPDPPKAVRIDELAVEVYWHAPNLSKQRVVGERDTLLLPADIGYYSDRYGIVENNFPDSIRLGDGRDVRGVPHPLAKEGPVEYDFAIADTLRITIADRAIDVYQVLVRPRDPAAARVVGTLSIDRESGALVRLAITFTRAAILDQRIETLAVTLDNALIGGRYWLPHHQELEVVRTGTWLDYPVRGIIRGRWDICCYVVNRGLPVPAFYGPEIVFVPASDLARYRWSGNILDSLPPDVSLATVDDAHRVEQTAHRLMSTAALTRVRGAALSARGISDIVRVDRVEGLALGAGVTRYVRSDWTGALRGRYGLADQAANGEARLGWDPWGSFGLHAAVYRRFRDVGDIAESSVLANSIAAQEFGADDSDPYDARGADIGASIHALGGLRWQLDVARETQRALAVHATPATGRYLPTLPALALLATRADLQVDQPTRPAPWGGTWRAHVDVRGEWYTPADTALPHPVAVGRGFLALAAERPIGRTQLVTEASIGAVTADGVVPPQEEIYAGGPTTGPGYPYHAFVARTTSVLRAEWEFPVPAPAIPLGRLGATPRTVTVAPFVVGDYIDNAARFRPRPTGWYPAAGISVLAIFNLLRVDVARGLRRPGGWTLWIDVNRDWWGVL